MTVTIELPQGFLWDENEGRPVWTPRRVIVCGSRAWTDRERIREWVAEQKREYGSDGLLIVHGDAPLGADRMVYLEAMAAGVMDEPHPARWDIHDREGASGVPCRCREKADFCKAAGFRRNEKMARLGADECVAFWDDKSHGTGDMIERAEAHGIHVDIVRSTTQTSPLDESRVE